MKKPSNKNRIKILLQLELCENCLKYRNIWKNVFMSKKI